MRSSLLSLFLLGLFLQWVTAAPTRLQKRTFKVERTRNPNFKGRNGPRELVKAYRKYSMPIPQGLLDTLRAQGAAKADVDDGTRKVSRSPFGPGGGHGGPGGGAGGGPGGGPAGGPGGGPAGGPMGGPMGGPGCHCPSCPCGGNNPAGNGPESNSTANSVPEQEGESDVGVVTATPEAGDIEYLSPVTIGGQTFNLDFDTGSSDLWVFSTGLSPAESKGHQLFDPNQSPSFELLDGASFSITYGDDSGAKGIVGTDTVDIGGVVVKKQAVELATQVTDSFVEDIDSQGLLGLAFSKLNTVQPQQQKTFFDNVLPTLAEPVFTADLRPGEPGAYEFGRIDDSKFVGDMAWIPVNTTNGFWQFSTSGFAAGDDGVITGLATSQAIADTGTTLMIVSQEVSDGYYSKVAGARQDDDVGAVIFPCDSELPDLFVDVGGVYVAKVKGEDINFAQISADTCFGGIQPTTSSEDLQIWGDIFFKSQFVAFDGGNNMLGMAEHI